MTNEYNHTLPVMSVAVELMRTAQCQCHYHIAKALLDAGLFVTDEEWKKRS